MLNLKHGQIRTMAQDVASLQGKSSKESAVLEKNTIEGDLESRLANTLLEMERRNASSGLSVEQPPIQAQIPPAPGLPNMPVPAPTSAPPDPAPNPPQPDPALAGNSLEKQLEEKIAKEMMASLPDSFGLQMEKPPAPPQPAAQENEKEEKKPESEKIKLKKPEPAASLKDNPPAFEIMPKSEAEIEEKVKKELEEEREKLKLQKLESAEKDIEEEKKKKLEEKTAKEKEDAVISEEEKKRLKRKGELELPVLLKEAKERICIDRSEVEKHLADLATKDEPLEKQRAQLKAEVELAKSGELGLIVEKEKEIEDKKERLEKTGAANLTLADEKLLSQKLWDIEDKRKQIERRRWEIEDQITRSEIEIKKIELELADKNEERNKIREVVSKLTAKEKLIDFVEKKKTWIKEITKIREEKDGLLPEAETIASEKQDNEDTLKELIESEKAITEELKMVEEKEKQALTYDEKRVIEKMRWKVESDMRRTIKEKWQHVLAREKIDEAEKNILAKIENTENRLKTLEDEISAEEIILEKEGLNVRKIREEIGTIFEETGFDFDDSILEEIDQSDLVISDYHEEETEAWVKKPETKEPEEETEPSFANPENPVPENKPAAAFREDGDYRKKSSLMAAEPAQPAEQAPVDPQARVGREPLAEDARPNGSFLEPIDDKGIGSAPKTNLGFRDVGPEQPAPALDNRWPRENESAADNRDLSALYQSPRPIKKETEEEEPDNPWTNRWSQTQKPSFPDPEINPMAAAAGRKERNETKQDDELSLSEDLPAKSSSGKKLMIRILILLVSLAVIGGIVLIVFTKKSNDKPNEEEPNTEEPAGDDDSTGDDDNDDSTGDDDNDDSTGDDDSEPPAEPTSLISTVSTLNIKGDGTDIPDKLSAYLERKFEGEGYYRILIQNKDDEYIGVREFFDLFDSKTPDNLFDHLSGNFTLFVYASKGDNRLGLIAEISDPDGFESLMKKWETTMEKDLGGFFKFLGKTKNASPSFFKTGSIPNSQTKFRYLSFPLPPSNTNSGLCYASNDKYFILTSSGESLIKIFNQLVN
ncbi:MAG TPA: hypothetical protein P5080_04480 [Candidatus Paceibacterota bacterium]|nr:hypothetical protein [Candidatus Pacearchaeota archaeon]HRZ51209.1 hypothetical protein [Candidatus Paceibacterota bacterium]HSA36931.1 hypothetical protein [Candidatus Paceibacterota bacterium]